MEGMVYNLFFHSVNSSISFILHWIYHRAAEVCFRDEKGMGFFDCVIYRNNPRN